MQIKKTKEGVFVRGQYKLNSPWRKVNVSELFDLVSVYSSDMISYREEK